MRCLRILAATAALLGAGLLTAASAEAAGVNFQGYTDGCFGSGCTPASVSTNVGARDATKDLFYRNATFNANSDSSGFLGLGATASTDNTVQNFNNFGSFILGPGSYSYAGDIFDLLITITVPNSSPGAGTFTSTVSGSVTGTTDGGIFVDFDNTPKTFLYNGGFYTLSVNDVSDTVGNRVAVTGTFQATAVPGPVAGAGIPAVVAALGGLFWAARRRAIAA